MDLSSQPELYGTLGVSKDASLENIRSAHRKLVLKCHPDRAPDEPALQAQAIQRFYQVQQAYEILGDEIKRAEYDHRVRVEELKEEQILRMKTSVSVDIRTPGITQSLNPSSHLRVFQDGEDDDRPRRRWTTYSSRDDPYVSSRASPTPKVPNFKTSSRQRSMLLDELRRSVEPLSRARCREIATQVGMTEETLREWLQKRRVRHPVSGRSRADKGNAEVKHDSGQLPRKIDREKQLSKDTNTITGLEGTINGTPVCALPDTGAELNFMAAAFATDLGLEFTHYPRGQEPSFVLGHGRTIKAIGELIVTWQFKKERDKSYDIVIYILPDCIFDVMIGAAFLCVTKTMSTHRDRLSNMPRPRRALGTRFVNLCGLPNRRLHGTLHNEFCTALPDSGAEPNLLSYKYVKRRGWLLGMYPGPESCRLLQFADGSTERTEGRLKLKWSFNKKWELASADNSLAVTFDVLRGCTFDIILGEDFLQETEVFVNHNEACIDVSVEGAGGINLVIFATGFLRSALKPKSKIKALSSGQIDDDKSDELHQELERRAIADRMIAKMKNDPTTHARELAKEAQRRMDWEMDHPVNPPKASDPPTPSRSSSGARAPGIPNELSATQIHNLSTPEVDSHGIPLDPSNALTPNRTSPKPDRPGIPPELPDSSTPGQSSHTASRSGTSAESISSSPRPPTLRRMRKFWGRGSEDRPFSGGDQQPVPVC